MISILVGLFIPITCYLAYTYLWRQPGQASSITPLYSLTPDKVKGYDDRPWRPFRWPYHQTMSIYKLDLNHWLDMDKWYSRYIREKEIIFSENRQDCCDWLPESKEACEELLETVVEHMLARYPACFKKTSQGIHNLITDEQIDLRKPYKLHPLQYIGKMAKEDFYVVQQRPDGLHYMVAGAVPFPGGHFSVKEILGKHLDVIHSDVPYYETKLKPSMERWFGKLKCADPVERATWYMTWDHELVCSKIYDIQPGETMPQVPVEKFVVRVERQTLRRLPKTQAIIFTNHPLFYSVDEMKDEPMVPSLLKNIIMEGPENIVKSKKFETVREQVVPYLDKLIERQINRKIITPGQPVRTLPSYPFAQWADVSKDTGTGWSSAHI